MQFLRPSASLIKASSLGQLPVAWPKAGLFGAAGDYPPDGTGTGGDYPLDGTGTGGV